MEVTLLLSSGVVAAIVSTLFGGISIFLTHKLKRNSDISTFRYTKLYELNNEINSLTPTNYDLSNTQTLVNQSTDKHGKITAIYNKVLPLLNPKYKINPMSILIEEDKLSNKLVENLYASKVITENDLLKNLLFKRVEFEKAIKEAISLTLVDMLK